MQNIDIQLQADVSELLQQLQEVRKSMTSLRTTNEQVRDSFSGTFDDAIDGADTLLGRAANVNKVYQRMQKELADVIKYQQVLKKLAAESVDPAKAERYRKELEESKKVVEALTKSLSGLSGAARSAEAGAAGIGKQFLQFAAAGGAIAVIAQLGKEIIKAAANTEQYRITFQALSKSVLEGNQLFDDLVTLAAKTPFELPQLQQSAKSLLAYGFSAKEVAGELKFLGDISAGVGQDKLPQIILAYGQVRAATKLTGNELRQFTEAGIPLLAQLAADGGKSVRQIQKDISDGSVTFEQVQKSLKSLTSEGGQFFQLMEKQSKSFNGQISNLKDTFTQIASDIGSIFLPVIKSTVEGFGQLIGSVKSILGLNKTMEESINEQGQRFTNLIGIVKDTSSSYSAKQRAIATLKQEFPELIKGIDLQKASEAQLNGILASGNITLRERIELNKKKGELDKTQSELTQLLSLEEKSLQKIQQLEENKIGQAQRYKEIAINSEKERLSFIRLRISAVEAKGKYQQAEIKTISGARNTPSSLTPTATDLTDEQKKAAEKSAAELKAIKEKIAAENRKIDEQDRVENLKNLEKALEEEKIRLENHVKEVQELIVKGKGNKAITEQGNALIERLTKESAESVAKIRAEYAIKEAQALQEKYDIIDKYTNEGLDKEVAALERSLDIDRKKLDALGATNEEIAVIYEAHFKKVAALEQKYELQRLKDFEDTDKNEVGLLKKQLEGTLDAQKTSFLATKRSEKEIDDFKAKQATQREINAEIVQKRLLEIELFYAQKRAELTGKPDQENIDNLSAQIAALDGSINSKAGSSGQTGKKGKKGKYKNVWELLGFPEDQSALLQEATSQTVAAINEIAAAQVAAADAAVEAADKRVGAAEDALDREIELAKLGFASNVDARKADLENAKASQAQALEEKRKAARLQLAIDAAQQASAVGLSIANLISSWSTIPFGIGLILAAAQAATIIGLIASTKAKASAISQNQFEKGGGGRVTSKGVIIGNRHSDGGVPLEVEGGEFFTTDGNKFAVVNRKMTHKHFGLLEAVNNDDRWGMMNHLQSMVGLDRTVPDRLLKAHHQNNVIVNHSSDTAAMQENNSLLRQILKNTEAESVTDLGDSILIKKGSMRKILKK